METKPGAWETSSEERRHRPDDGSARRDFSRRLIDHSIVFDSPNITVIWRRCQIPGRQTRPALFILDDREHVIQAAANCIWPCRLSVFARGCTLQALHAVRSCDPTC